jgi:hypothetical protein
MLADCSSTSSRHSSIYSLTPGQAHTAREQAPCVPASQVSAASPAATRRPSCQIQAAFLSLGEPANASQPKGCNQRTAQSDCRLVGPPRRHARTTPLSLHAVDADLAGQFIPRAGAAYGPFAMRPAMEVLPTKTLAPCVPLPPDCSYCEGRTVFIHSLTL